MWEWIAKYDDGTSLIYVNGEYLLGQTSLLDELFFKSIRSGGI
jgi:hypothetical protein